MPCCEEKEIVMEDKLHYTIFCIPIYHRSPCTVHIKRWRVTIVPNGFWSAVEVFIQPYASTGSLTIIST